MRASAPAIQINPGSVSMRRLHSSSIPILSGRSPLEDTQGRQARAIVLWYRSGASNRSSTPCGYLADLPE